MSKGLQKKVGRAYALNFLRSKGLLQEDCDISSKSLYDTLVNNGYADHKLKSRKYISVRLLQFARSNGLEAICSDKHLTAYLQAVEGVPDNLKIPNSPSKSPPYKDNKRKQEWGDGFYTSFAWRSLRYEILIKYGRVCMLCGDCPPHTILHVDHIKPRSLHPELELDPKNMQILCEACNKGKSNKDSTDFRPVES